MSALDNMVNEAESKDEFTKEEFYEVFDFIKDNGVCICNPNGMWPAVYLITKNDLFFYCTHDSDSYDLDIFVTTEEKKNLISLGLGESVYHAAFHYNKPKIEGGDYKLTDVKKILLN